MGKFGSSRKGEAIVTANKTVAAPATAEQLTTEHKFVEWVIVQALESNTDNIILGDSSAVTTTERGTALAPLNSITLEGLYLDEIYLDAVVAGEGVSFTYKEKRKL